MRGLETLTPPLPQARRWAGVRWFCSLPSWVPRSSGPRDRLVVCVR